MHTYPMQCLSPSPLCAIILACSAAGSPPVPPPAAPIHQQAAEPTACSYSSTSDDARSIPWWFSSRIPSLYFIRRLYSRLN